MSTDILGIDLIAVNQKQKEVIANEAIQALENKLCDVAEIEVTAGANAVSQDFFCAAVCLVLVAGSPAPSAPFDVELPAIKGPVIVRNATSYDATVNVAGNATTVGVDSGAAALLYSDGTAVHNVVGGTSSGATAFTGLTDVPSAYSSAGGKVVSVKADESGLEFVDAPSTVGINEQTASYELVLTDAGKLVTLNSAAAVSVTVPPASSVTFPVGTRILLAQYGAGAVTVVEGSGVTVSAPESLQLRGQYAQASLVKLDTDLWILDPYAAAPEGDLPYDIGCAIIGAPTESEVVMRFVAPRAFTLASGLAGSAGQAGVGATAQTDFDVQRNGVSFGTVRFAVSGAVASFVAASAQAFAAGDVLEVIAPSAPDATLANISITFAGIRS